MGCNWAANWAGGSRFATACGRGGFVTRTGLVTVAAAPLRPNWSWGTPSTLTTWSAGGTTTVALSSTVISNGAVTVPHMWTSIEIESSPRSRKRTTGRPTKSCPVSVPKLSGKGTEIVTTCLILLVMYRARTIVRIVD